MNERLTCEQSPSQTKEKGGGKGANPTPLGYSSPLTPLTRDYPQKLVAARRAGIGGRKRKS